MAENTPDSGRLAERILKLADLVEYQEGSVVSRTIIDQKTGTLTHFSNSRLLMVSYTLYQTWVPNRALPDLDLDDDGEMAVVKYGMSSDDLFPIS